MVVGTSSILERQLSLLRGLTSHILIVASQRSRSRVEGARVVVDRIAGAGALGGLYTALMEAPTEQILVMGCDMPFLNPPFLTYLAEQGRDADVVVPRDEHGRHPLCASYARRVAAHLLGRITAGQLRVNEALSDLTVRELGPEQLAPYNLDGRLLANINTPGDYTQARTQ